MDYQVIIDSMGRTILGEVVEDDGETLTLNNPIIMHFQAMQNGQLNLQLFPLFFFELIDANSRDINRWCWDKRAIVFGKVKLTQDILDRYEAINTPAEEKTDEVKENPKVISIDDI